MNTSLQVHQDHIDRVLATRAALKIVPSYEGARIDGPRRDKRGRFAGRRVAP